jgi:hypothetical protein
MTSASHALHAFPKLYKDRSAQSRERKEASGPRPRFIQQCGESDSSEEMDHEASFAEEQIIGILHEQKQARR